MTDVLKDVGWFCSAIVAILLGMLLIGVVYFGFAMLLIVVLALVSQVLPDALESKTIPWMPHDAILSLSAVLFLYWQAFGFVLPALKAVFVSIARNEQDGLAIRPALAAVLAQAKIVSTRFNHFKVIENGL
jgi:hypothetical protein